MPAGSTLAGKDSPLPPISSRELYDREIFHVWNFLRRLGARDPDLEDLVQETFAQFFKSIGTYDGQRSVRSWLFGIAFNVASDYRRRAHRAHEVSTAPSRMVRARSLLPTPDKAAQDRELVLHALEKLPMNRRVVFVMYELEGENVRDIAANLELPSNTVYSRLRVARAEFLAAIRELEEMPDAH